LEGSSPDPQAHDNQLHDIPDTEAMDEAVADFLRRFEKRGTGQLSGYHRLHAALSRLLLPGKVDQMGVSIYNAIEAGMLPQMD
jgi:hypothetical protein